MTPPLRGRLLRTRAALLCLCLCACGSGSSLEGSVGDDIPLNFDATEVQHSATAVAVIYLRSLAGGGGQDVLLKVSANTSGLDLSQALQIDLTEMVGNAQRGAVSRSVSGDDRRDFGPLSHGFIRFDQAPVVGDKVSGSFSVTFEQGVGLGAGKTAFGDFSATLAEAGQ